jgi:hypothetical protein
MKLITEVSLPDYPFRMDHRHPLLFMGSCFTENIGHLMERYLFRVCINPFGVTYNPVSVMKGLEALAGKEAYRQGDLDQTNGLWFSFDHYTRFSSPDPEECLEGINEAFSRAKQMLSQARVLVITWGTAWVYRYKPTGRVVCNCHKIPASRFDRSRLTTEEITAAYGSFLPRLFDVNPDLKVLLTVSPVRHWKDGARGNQLSKASLLLATEQLEQLFPGRVFYFPSYEIVMDELRDYRFYAGDLLHTNDLATTWLWEKFRHALISGESQGVIRELEPVLKMMEHRPWLKKGEAHDKTIRTMEEKLLAIRKKLPFVDWDRLGQID